jgi:hypothetical protein
MPGFSAPKRVAPRRAQGFGGSPNPGAQAALAALVDGRMPATDDNGNIASGPGRPPRVPGLEKPLGGQNPLTGMKVRKAKMRLGRSPGYAGTAAMPPGMGRHLV